MAQIIVGNDPIDRPLTPGNKEATSVDRNNPASEAAYITQVKIHTPAAITNVKVASFYVVSGNNLSTRNIATIGSVPAGYSEHDVSVAFEAGDYIGICGTPDNQFGNMDLSKPGALGAWWTMGLHIPATNYAFTLYADWILSLQGLSAEPKVRSHGFIVG